MFVISNFLRIFLRNFKIIQNNSRHDSHLNTSFLASQFTMIFEWLLNISYDQEIDQNKTVVHCHVLAGIFPPKIRRPAVGCAARHNTIKKSKQQSSDGLHDFNNFPHKD